MPRFFVRQDRIFDDHISIIGDDAHHIARSLRMAVGEQITVCNMQGTEYECEIASFNEDFEVIATIISQKASENEPKIFITLYQALPKQQHQLSQLELTKPKHYLYPCITVQL